MWRGGTVRLVTKYKHCLWLIFIVSTYTLICISNTAAKRQGSSIVHFHLMVGIIGWNHISMSCSVDDVDLLAMDLGDVCARAQRNKWGCAVLCGWGAVQSAHSGARRNIRLAQLVATANSVLPDLSRSSRVIQACFLSSSQFREKTNLSKIKLEKYTK